MVPTDNKTFALSANVEKVVQSQSSLMIKSTYEIFATSETDIAVFAIIKKWFLVWCVNALSTN